MIKEIYNFTVSDGKTIEKVVNDPVAMINHMILPKGECLPVHNANSNVYMIVARGSVTLVLDEKPAGTFAAGTLLNIEFGTLMSVCNTNDAILELFVVKAPAPSHYPA